MRLSLFVFTLALALAPACSRTPQAETSNGTSALHPTPPTAEVAAAIHDRAGRRFAAAQLVRPSGQGELPFDVYLAPMIVQEVRGDDPVAAPLFGRLALGEDGAAVVLPEPPTVYYMRSRVVLDGAEREQLAFLWWYPDSADGALRAQGIRMTLGKSGVPILWEVLEDPSGARIVFVSETLEELARLQHGEPLEGRRHSTEASLQAAPRVVVARSISNGATPMGPFVYLELGSRTVRTLLCRCSPAEYDELSGDALFELEDLAALAEIGLTKDAWTPELPHPADAAPPPQPDEAAPDWLGRVLRLPSGL